MPIHFEKVMSETSPYFFPCFLPPLVVSRELKYSSSCLAIKERLERFEKKLPEELSLCQVEVERNAFPSFSEENRIWYLMQMQEESKFS